nr:hypothetical protein B0A51_11224 [Rachicladosporium sp. CCFEE 5018]
MEQGGKRKAEASGRDGDDKRTKTKKQWQVPRKNGRDNEPARAMQPGDSGIFATCIKGKEGKCVGELRDLFTEYAGLLYGAATGEDQQDDDGAADDIEKSLDAEIASIKKPSTAHLFSPVKIDVQCVVFFRTVAPVDPVGLVSRICEDAVANPQRKRTRTVKRLVPMTMMGRASAEGLEKVANEVLAPHFHTEPISLRTYAIRTNIRNHSILKREDIINQVASLVGPPHTVDLKNYDHLILVEVYQNICGVSVIDRRFEELKRYNLSEIFEPTAKESTQAVNGDSVSLPLLLDGYAALKDGRGGLSPRMGYRHSAGPISMSITTKPARSVDRATVMKVAGAVLKSSNIQVESYHGCLYRTFLLRAKDDTFCLMKCMPHPSIRLMRLEDDQLATEAAVLRLLDRRGDIAPAVVDYQAASSTLGTSYLISGPFTGTVLGTSSSPLSGERRQTLDRSIGRHVSRLATLTGRAFGPLLRPYTQSWAQCFGALLESVLRDAEDCLISLPYDAVRLSIRKHASALDKISEPQLTLLGAAGDDNVAFDPRSHRLTSLLDYGTAIWGDPMMSDYLRKPSKAFLVGYGERIVDDSDARIRQLLYILYHAVYSIVEQCIRPHADDDSGVARRSLTTALRCLVTLPVP